MDLTSYDAIIINTSAGKDSQAMMDYIHELAEDQGVTERLVAVHADLGRVEWKGTRELAEAHAAAYDMRIEVVSRPQGDLIDQIRDRGMFPSSAARYCTSDQKRGQVAKVFTKLTAEIQAERGKGYHVRILNCMGLRAQESPARAKKTEIEANVRASNTKRTVTNWHPILSWKAIEVFARCERARTELHEAYALGMPRLSCVFCVLASESALVLAAKHNPELAQEYVELEAEIGHTFQNGRTIASIVDKAKTDDVTEVADWAA